MLKQDSQKILFKLNQAFKSFPDGQVQEELDHWHSMALEGLPYSEAEQTVEYIILNHDTINKAHNLVKIFVDAYKQVTAKKNITYTPVDHQPITREPLAFKATQLYIGWQRNMLKRGYTQMELFRLWEIKDQMMELIDTFEKTEHKSYFNLSNQIPKFARRFRYKSDEKLKKVFA